MNIYFGYARTSTRTQKLKSQISTLEDMGCELENIFTDQYTGTVDSEEREGWRKLLKEIKKKKYEGKNKIICFMSVNRMSRDKVSGVRDYFKLIDKGYELVFQMEPTINSSVYGDKIKNASSISVDDKQLNETVIKGLREYLVSLAKQQIEIAFDQAEKEAKHIKEKVKRGLMNSDKKAGRKKGYTSKKKKNIPISFIKDSKEVKNITTLSRLHNVSRPTIYSWLKEIENANDKTHEKYCEEHGEAVPLFKKGK